MVRADIKTLRSPLLWITLLLGALVGIACASQRGLTVVDEGLSVPVDALVVAPFEVRYPADPWASYLRTVEEVRGAVDAGHYPVYAYGDFDAFQLEGEDLYAGRSALSLVAAAGLDPQRVALLRGKARATSLGLHQSGGNRPTDGDIDIVLSVELLHLGSRRAIAQGERVIRVSPLDKTGDGDPYPKLTQAHRALVADVLDAAMERVPGDPSVPIPAVLLEPHGRIFSVASDEAPSIASRMETMDPLSKDGEILKVYGWLYPDISPRSAAALMNPPSGSTDRAQGLYVESSQLEGIKAGEWILSADDLPLAGLHQLHRLWYTAFPGTSILLKVQGDEGVREVTLQKPED